MKDEPLFDLPEAIPVKRAKTMREIEREQRPQWSRYRPKQRMPCDECIALLHEAGGAGPYANSARWRCRIGDTVILLCKDHAETRRKGETA